MPTLDMIRDAVRRAAAEYPVKRVELFGSYANGTADEESDVATAALRAYGGPVPGKRVQKSSGRASAAQKPIAALDCTMIP